MPRYSWIIIGGGLHGVFHAHNLVARMGVPPASIAIIDPKPELLHRWLQQCQRCGMEYMRSNSSHCLSSDFRDLRRYAGAHGYDESHFLQPYSRPSLELFAAHSRSCITASRLSDQHIRDQVMFLRKHRGGWTAVGQESKFSARRVLLAPGRVPPPLPDWSRGLSPEKVAVLLNPMIGSGVDELPHNLQVAIVGGGITGIGAAVYSADQRTAAAAWAGAPVATTPAPVDLYCTRPPVENLFDFDPGYLGPKRKGVFSAAAPEVRAKLVREARNPGSAPPELLQRLSRHADTGAVRIHVQAIRQAEQVANYDRILMAGGTDADIPDIFRQTAVKYGLATAGYPVLQEDCSWTDGLYVSGAAAYGIIGPAAPNIIGAHLAYRRIHGMRTMRG